MKVKYLFRLDDACPFRDVLRWDRMEKLLDQYGVKPLIGVIPNCQDPTMVSVYDEDLNFRQKVSSWVSKGYTLALHGCTHVYLTDCGGLNPINKRSEFAGVSLSEQKIKIKEGVETFKNMFGFEPKVFFAPSHTFDENTLLALEECSEIRNISDTIADAPYFKHGFTFVPVQSGVVRNLPFEYTTFCYHPNMMKDETEWENLEKFLKRKGKYFISYEEVMSSNRRLSLLDKFYSRMYFFIKKIK